MKSRAPLHRDDIYLRYVREHVSCLQWERASGIMGGGAHPLVALAQPLLFDEVEGALPTVAHHVRIGYSGGMGAKPSDYRTVPLTDHQHKTLHQMGETSFWAQYGLSPFQVIAALLINRVGERGLDILAVVGWDHTIQLVETLEEVISRRAA